MAMALRSVVTPEQFEALKNEFVRFFTIEGIVSRLQFLNPTVVIQDVEMILHRYQDYYKMEMSGHIRLNLYMHIAFMFERLRTYKSITKRILSYLKNCFPGFRKEIPYSFR